VGKRIVLAGYYGFGNAGDDAILEAILAELGRSHPEVAVTVVTYPEGDVGAIRRRVGCEAIDGRSVGAVKEAIASADLLVIGGGGLIQDYLPGKPADRFTARASNLSFWTTVGLTAVALDIPITTWAVGVGPLTTAAGRQEAGLLFGMMETVSVRDDLSKTLVEDLGGPRVVVHADPVFALESSGTDPMVGLLEVEDLPHDGRLRIAVSVRGWGPDGAWIDRVAAGLDEIIETFDADVLLVALQAGTGLANDALVSTRVAARMRHADRRAVVAGDLSPREKLDLISHSDLLIGMRLHSVIFASSRGIPIVAIPYDPKVQLAMESLALEDFIIPLDFVSPQRMVETVTRALAMEPEESKRYRESRVALAAAARSTVDFVMAQAERRGSAGPVVLALGDAALRRSAEVEATEGVLATTITERDQARAAHAHMTEAYDKLAAEYQALMDARPIRLVRRLWRIRARLVDSPRTARRLARRTAARILPSGAKKALRRAVGPAHQPGDDALGPEELAEADRLIRHQLEALVRSHPDAPGFVILPPGIGWDVDLFQRPQQMALAFAHLGYPVLYHLQSRYRHGLVGYEPPAQGVTVGYLPDELVDLLHLVPQPIYLSYVYNFEWRSHLENPITVYEHIDHLEVFEHVYERADLERWHRTALAEATVPAGSAMDLLAELRAERSDAILVPNGVDYDHFAGPSDEPTDIAHLGRRGPIVGYYGALAEWFDYALLDYAAKALPEADFLLIGPDYDGTAARAGALARDNVHWIGPRPYASLPGYLACFDVATVPFVVNEVTHAVSPLKLFEYMAGGKPVVTTSLRECSRYRAVQIGDGPDGYVQAIRTALDLAKDPAHVELLKRTARANTWDSRARTIIEAVERSKARSG
jgi:polysaccharide pyruvyl transferase CsaB